jgi:CDP-diacylglycerol---glycerol-3-phosphate 3-phosphatidyltransferase
VPTIVPDAADPERRRFAPSAGAAPKALVREWLGWAVAGSSWLAGMGVLVAGRDSDRWAAWLPPSALVLGYVLLFSRSRLGLHRKNAGNVPFSSLGLGTSLTMARGLLIAPLAGLLFLPRLPGTAAWVPTLLYTAAGLTDQFDGYWARRLDQATRLGEMLDVELDGLGVLLAASLAVHYRQLPLFFVTVAFARYFFLLWGAAWRLLGRELRPLPSSLTRRSIAGLQIGFLAGVLWPIAPPELTTLAGWIFAVPFIASFTRDLLVVAGLVDLASPLYMSLRSSVWSVATRVAPPVLRLAVVLLAGRSAILVAADLPGRASAFAERGMEAAGAASSLLLGLEILSVLLMAAGFLGRTGALGVILAEGLTMAALGASNMGLLICALAAAVLILGTGPASLWSPEPVWLGRRGGRRD